MSRQWIVDALGESGFHQLAEQLGGSELQSVLLEVMPRRAAARTPHEVLAQYRRDSFVTPAAVDQRTAVAIDAVLLAAADGFEAVELSPVAPLGTCSTIALTAELSIPTAIRARDQPYYSGGLRYMLWVTAPDGREVALADGGTFDWLAKLTSNRRAAYIASGAGAQLIPLVFGA